MVEGLTKALRRDGLTVASIKHSTHARLDDEKNKDTWRHAKAGCNPVLLITPEGAIVRVKGAVSVDKLIQIIRQISDPDVVIIEGFKDGHHPKVSLGNIERRKGTVMSDPTVKELAEYVKNEVAADKVWNSLPGLDCHKCGLDCKSMARAIVARDREIGDCEELSSRHVAIMIGGKKLAVGAFVSEIVDDTVRGMLSSLKGYEPGKDVEIRLRAVGKKAKGSRPKRA